MLYLRNLLKDVLLRESGTASLQVLALVLRPVEAMARIMLVAVARPVARRLTRAVTVLMVTCLCPRLLDPVDLQGLLRVVLEAPRYGFL